MRRDPRGLAFAANEPAADRVVGLPEHESVVVADRRRLGRRCAGAPDAGCGEAGDVGVLDAVRRRPRFERHRVRMPWQPRPRSKDHVGLHERHPIRSVQHELPALRPVRPPRADGIRVHRLGRESLQTGDDRIRSAVADARRAQRSVQGARHAGDVVDDARFAQTDGEVTGGPHGSDRVGARGSYTDGEQLERGNVGAHTLQATPRPEARARPSARRTPRTSAVRGAGCAERIVTARPAAVPRWSRVPG